MLLATLFVLLVSCTLGYVLDRRFSNYLSLYSIVWIITVFLSSLKLYGQVGFSEDIYNIIIIGDICFTLGYLVFCKFSRTRESINKRQIIPWKNVTTNKGLWKLSLLFCTAINLYIGILVASLLLGGADWYTIRYNYFSEGQLYGSFISLISSWIVVPITTYVSFPMLLIEFEGKRADKTIAFLTIFNMLLRVLITGGKGIIVVFVVNLLVYLLAFSQKKGIKRKTAYIIILSLFSFFVLNGLRSGDYNFEFLYHYLGITLPLMDHWMDYIDKGHIWGDGQIFLYGIINVPISIIDKLDPSIATGFNNLGKEMDSMVSEGVRVFENMGPTTNVYLSNLTYFYLDGRIWGVVIESFLFGCLCKIVERKIKRNNDYSVALFILFSTCVFDSFIKWDLYTSSYVLSFLYLRLFYKTRERRQFNQRIRFI